MIIFLDLDGVLAQCHETALREHGCKMEYGKPMHQIVNDQVGSNWGRQEFWDKFDFEFWATLPKTPLCDSLFSMARARGEVYILTKPTNNPECYAGKAEWCRRHGLLNNLMLVRHKSLLSAPGRLLIDDHPLNVQGFRGGGGKAILVPRPWNDQFHDDPSVLDDLRDIL